MIISCSFFFFQRKIMKRSFPRGQEDLPHIGYTPLYRLPHYGEADVATVCLAEVGEQRVFTKVRYRFPGERVYRYQAFYRSSGAHSAEKGVWFPCDGIVMVLETPSRGGGIVRKRKARPWIVKVSQTQTARRRIPIDATYDAEMTRMPVGATVQQKQVYVDHFSFPYRRREMARRYGSPILFVIALFLTCASSSDVTSLLSQRDVEDMSSLLGARAPIQYPPSCVEAWECERRRPKPGVHQDELINRFIGDALSINWLRDVPRAVSLYANEYDREKTHINLNDVLDMKAFVVYRDWKRVLALDLPDGRRIIPDFVLMSPSLRFIESVYEGGMKLFREAQYDDHVMEQGSMSKRSKTIK